MAINLLDTLQESINTLRPSERKVAVVVLSDPTITSKATLSEIAGLAGVSEPTVLRFARTLGFDGFQDFKYALIQNLASGVPAIHSVVDVNDSVAEIALKLFDQSILSFKRSYDELDLSALEAAIRAIRNGSDLLILGFGASGIVGQDAAQKFPLFGIPINAPIDAHQQFIASTLCSASSIVFAISNTASTFEVLEASNEAKARGATIIALCGTRGPITEMADISIVVNSFDNTDTYTPSISRLSNLVIIDILAVGVAVNKSPEQIIELERMKTRLSDMRKGRRNLESNVNSISIDSGDNR
jgi:hypothetical protein